MTRLALAIPLTIPEPMLSIAWTLIAVGGLLAAAGVMAVERRVTG